MTCTWVEIFNGTISFSRVFFTCKYWTNSLNSTEEIAVAITTIDINSFINNRKKIFLIFDEEFDIVSIKSSGFNPLTDTGPAKLYRTVLLPSRFWNCRKESWAPVFLCGMLHGSVRGRFVYSRKLLHRMKWNKLTNSNYFI